MTDAGIEAVIDGATPENPGTFEEITDPVQKNKRITEMFVEPTGDITLDRIAPDISEQKPISPYASTIPEGDVLLQMEEQRYLADAREMAETLRVRGKSIPEIESAHVILDGNMTLVILNKEFVGWAKFNPNDTTEWIETSKRGKLSRRITSKYSNRAGTMRAIRRALKYMATPRFKF